MQTNYNSATLPSSSSLSVLARLLCPIIIFILGTCPMLAFAGNWNSDLSGGGGGGAKADSSDACFASTLDNIVEKFDLISDDKCVALTWKTAQTAGLSEYVIKRTTDNGLETVGTLPIDASKENYQFMDMGPQAGVTIYHLFSTDFNGVTCLLESDLVEIHVEETLDMTAYPNPVGSNAVLNLDVFNGLDSESAILTVYDQYGKFVSKQQIDFTSLWSTVEFNTTGLETGRYTLFLSSGNQQKTYQVQVIQ